MRIVFVNKYATVTGGADRHALELAALLSERGHDIRFLAFRPDGEPQLPGRYINPTVTNETRGTIGKRKAFSVARTLLWNSAAAAAMVDLINDARPDIIHVHKIYPQLSAAPVVVAASRQVPIVQTAHDYEFISASPFGHARRSGNSAATPLIDHLVNGMSFAERRWLHVPKVKRWIVASDFVRAAHERRGIRPEVLQLFTRPPDHSERRSFGERRGLAFAGRLDRRKGIPDIVEIARRNPDIPIKIAGIGELEAEVRGAAVMLKNIEFLGHVDAKGVRELFAGARAAVMPSRWEEPAGLVALEAMLEGTPVVAYEAGGLTEYVERLHGGVVVPQGDLASLSEAAKLLHSDSGCWETLSAVGQAGVREFHAPGSYIAQIEEIYAEAAAAPSRAA